MKKYIFTIFILGVLSYFYWINVQNTVLSPVSTILPSSTPTTSPTPFPTPTIIPSKTLQTDYHVFQSFNNCGPAAMSMALRFYGINKSQGELGQQLRPYQNTAGNNDDKSVTLSELAEKSKEFDLVPYHRPAGTIQTIKQFISLGYPVIARTWLKPTDDIGHFRVIKGYTENTLIQDDSLQGKNLSYSIAEFNEIWKKFNYEYLVLVPEDRKKEAERILGENLNESVAWQKAVKLSEEELAKNPDDIYTRFNLSTALYRVGNYKRSVEEFEKVESRLPFRTLWYQIEPILSYYELGNYDRVFAITERVLNYHNRAFSELYLLRGNSYLKLGNKSAAQEEFQKAILYNNTFISKVPKI